MLSCANRNKALIGAFDSFDPLSAKLEVIDHIPIVGRIRMKHVKFLSCYQENWIAKLPNF